MQANLKLGVQRRRREAEARKEAAGRKLHMREPEAVEDSIWQEARQRVDCWTVLLHEKRRIQHCVTCNSRDAAG